MEELQTPRMIESNLQDLQEIRPAAYLGQLPSFLRQLHGRLTALIFIGILLALLPAAKLVSQAPHRSSARPGSARSVARTASHPQHASRSGGSSHGTPHTSAARGTHHQTVSHAGKRDHRSSSLARSTRGRSIPRYAAPFEPSPLPPEQTAAPAPESALASSPRAPFLYPEQLSSFFRTLENLQTGAQAGLPPDPASGPIVRILQFGDSHTAADLFTGAIRARLQARFGDGGLGFQFPGHPFPGYHLAGSSRAQTSGWLTEGNKFTQLGDGDLGLGGISISSAHPGESISLSTTCTSMEVQFLRQPGGGRLRFSDNGVFISDISTSAAAEEATEGLPLSSGPPSGRSPGTLTYACIPGLHSFELTTLDHAPVRLLGLVTEQPGITFECLGINGAVAPLMLRWNQTIFAQYLRERDPALIVLAYGTNEAAGGAGQNEEYVAAFDRLLGNLHRIVPDASILVLGPYDRATRAGRGRRAAWRTFYGTDRIIADQQEACRLHSCAFYDQRARMGGPGAMIRWAAAGLAQGDHTHLTGTGYRELADALYADLTDAYKLYQQRATPQELLPPRAPSSSGPQPRK